LFLYADDASGSVNNIFSTAKNLQFFVLKLLENNCALYTQNRRDEW